MAVRTVTPAEVQAAIARGGPVDLIDVRTGLEFNGAHAVGARHVPLSGLDPAAVMAARRSPEDATVYVICKSGARSASACAAFLDAGFANVASVAGGTDAWVAAGLPVERNAKAAMTGVLRQIGIMAAVAAIVLFLMPCSPYSVWGGAWCPVGSGSAAPAAADAAHAAGADFDFDRDVVAASRTAPVLIDFNATWCGPCKMLAPELDQVVAARAGKLTLVGIDVDSHRAAAVAQDVSSIPDVRLWKDGREIARFIGYRDQAKIAAWIDGALVEPAP